MPLTSGGNTTTRNTFLESSDLHQHEISPTQVSKQLTLFSAASQGTYSKHHYHGGPRERSVVTIPFNYFRLLSLVYFSSVHQCLRRTAEGEDLRRHQDGQPATARRKEGNVDYSVFYLYFAPPPIIAQFNLRFNCCPPTLLGLFFRHNFLLQLPFSLKIVTSFFRQIFLFYLSVKVKFRVNFCLVLTRILVKLLKYSNLNSQASARPPLKDIRWEENAEWQRIKRFGEAKWRYYRARRELTILTKAYGLKEQEFSEKKVPDPAEWKKDVSTQTEERTEGGTDDDDVVRMMIFFETLST